MLYGYTCLNMKSFYSILASFIFWPEDTSPNFTKEGGLITVPLLMHMLMHVADTPKILLVPGPSAILLNLLIDT